MHVALSKKFVSILDLDRKDSSLSNFILTNVISVRGVVKTLYFNFLQFSRLVILCNFAFQFSGW